MNDVVHDDSTGRDFHVGGQDRNLSEAEQLEQLSWYIHEHHPMPTASADKDAWLARLPDRLTHAAMLMLGAAVDHTMPSVAFTQGVEVQELPEFAAVVFIPQQPRSPPQRTFPAPPLSTSPTPVKPPPPSSTPAHRGHSTSPHGAQRNQRRMPAPSPRLSTPCCSRDPCMPPMHLLPQQQNPGLRQ